LIKTGFNAAPLDFFFLSS